MPAIPNGLTHRIFIVDDHPMFRFVLERLLELEPDLTVCGSAATSQEALDALARIESDLIVADLSLPGENGLDLIRTLRARYPRTPLLVVSAYQEPSYASRALEAGASAYVLKRAEDQELLGAVRRLLTQGTAFVTQTSVSTDQA